jgi:hypothetical protein
MSEKASSSPPLASLETKLLRFHNTVTVATSLP